MIQLTQDSLLALIHDASTRAATQAMAQFAAQHPINLPPPSPRQSRELSSTPHEEEQRQEEVNSRFSRPEVAQTQEQYPPQSRPPTIPLLSRGVEDPYLALVVAPPWRSPFSGAILAEALPADVKVSNLSEYDGTGDPQEHLDKFYAKIDCLEQLTQCFLHHFSMNKRVTKTAAFLFTIRQWENELLRDYIQRFVEAVHEVPHVNHELLASIIQQSLLPGRFKESIASKPPSTMEDLLMRSQKYIRIKESNASNPSSGVKKKGREEEKEPKKKEGHKHVPPTGFTHYTPLNASRGEILVVAEQQGLINQWPRKMKDNSKMIKWGPVGGDSANARKALVRAARRNNWQTPNQIHNINSDKQEKIAFSRQDLDPMRNHNNDALVISVTPSNFWVKKVLVDSRSSADIIFYDVYVQLRVDNTQLRKVNTPITDFSGEMIEPLREVTLPLSLGSYPKRSTKMVKFLVVKVSSAYNIILGRPSLNLFHAIASTFHMKLKFPTSDGVGEAMVDERMVRECYANTLKRS
ncbi:UNVERIFIED_CONTAM: hypothetical protein Sradi_5060900 [Sesamum radiatum]|uniref:Retrotransposon gag domain-containing protein n=1 Tax=Sesamum radiatum TaxID=300843 RepID=A0AAW2M1A6_SESRA